MSVQFNYELTKEGIAKLNAQRNIPKANKYQLTKWLAETVREAKRSAASMQKAGKGEKTGQMGRNIGMTVETTGDMTHGLVGTGVGGMQSVKYAKIQDEGGITHPTVTAKMRRWAWAMFHETKDEKFKWLALTKKGKLDVRIPASKWFSGVIDSRRTLLDEMLSPQYVLKVAETLGSK